MVAIDEATKHTAIPTKDLRVALRVLRQLAAAKGATPREIITFGDAARGMALLIEAR